MVSKLSDPVRLVSRENVISVDCHASRLRYFRRCASVCHGWALSIHVFPHGFSVYAQFMAIPRMPRSTAWLQKKASLEPAAKLAMMVGNKHNPSPTRCDHYAASNTSFPLRRGERVHRHDGLACPEPAEGSGLLAYLDLAAVARLGESVRRHVGVREGAQGWTDSQMVMSLVMLNLAGGESVDDLRVLEKDEGLGRLLLMAELHQDAAGRAQGAAQQVAQEEAPHGAVAHGGVQVPGPFPRRGRGGREAAAQSVHTGVQRRAEWASPGQRGPGRVRGEPFGAHRGDAGPRIEYGADYGRYADRDTQAAGQLLLQKAQGVPAADHVLV